MFKKNVRKGRNSCMAFNIKAMALEPFDLQGNTYLVVIQLNLDFTDYTLKNTH